MSMIRTVPTTRFDAPDDRIAAEPPEARGLSRDAVRLLVARPESLTHTTFRHLDQHLHGGDVLVINTSATVPGQLDGRRAGRPIVVHVANRLADGTRVVELRTAPVGADPLLDGQIGESIMLPAGGAAELLEPYPQPGSSPTGQGNRLWRTAVRVPGRLAEYLAVNARPISYGYLSRSYPIEHYQTIFALTPGSAEMPSAGRPFTPSLVSRLVAAGVVLAPITLHTSVSSTDAGEAPQSEWFEVPTSTATLVNSARAQGRRIVAVGTTSTRAIESAADPGGRVSPRSGWTDLVISPERPIRTVSGLITGWHDPAASHLLLVEAVAGPRLTQRAYDEAVRERYLWHEFGDSCLFLP